MLLLLLLRCSCYELRVAADDDVAVAASAVTNLSAAIPVTPGVVVDAVAVVIVVAYDSVMIVVALVSAAGETEEVSGATFIFFGAP